MHEDPHRIRIAEPPGKSDWRHTVSLLAESRTAAWCKTWMPCLLLGLGAFALLFDIPVARWVATHRIGGDLKELLTIAETFGHGIGVILIISIIWAINPKVKQFVPQMLAASLGAGLCANLIKLGVGRFRPRKFDFSDQAATVWDTFGSPFPAWHGITTMQSFPSSHSATAAGFAIALTAFVPRGRWLFATLATLSCLSRVHVGAHFPSDVAIGAAVGVLVGRVVANRFMKSRSDSGADLHEELLRKAA